MKRVIVLAMLMVFIGGCGNMSKTNKKSLNSAQEITSKHCDLKPFRSIVLSGNANVELVNGSHAIDVTGIRADKYNCQNRVMNQVLYTSNNNAVKITAPELRDITVVDHATISSKDFKTKKLSITAKDRGTVNLEGNFNVDNISQFGDGRINISWIDSDKLLIKSYGSGPIYLAGVVNNMSAKLTRNADLDARYLRVQNANIIATDSAQAEVSVLDALDAFAIDKSNIYYYKKPKQLTVVTRASGNVLQLDWIS